MSYYGIILPSYWTGQTGRALRRQGGKDAQLLGAYLFSYEHMNMIGLYRLTPADIRSELRLSTVAIQRAFSVMQDEAFAFYDLVSTTVFVREMARIRLNIVDEKPLARDDKKRIGAEKLYFKLHENPFFGLFFDRYHKVLHLKHRRESNASNTRQTVTPVRPQDVGPVSGIRSASSPTGSSLEGASKPGSVRSGSDSGTTGTSDLSNSNGRTALRSSGLDHQISKSSAAAAARFPAPPGEAPDANIGVITKIAHEAIDALGVRSNDLDESVKSLCAQLRIPYNSLVVGKAVESALAQRRRH